MTERMASSLAEALSGKAVRTMPQSRMWGVTLIRSDGKYVLLDQDAGAVYFDEHACWVGYHTLGEDPKGMIEAEEWTGWGLTDAWATGLATLIGADAYHSGGGVWVVLYHRPDGRLAVIGQDGAEIYPDAEAWDRYFENQGQEPERVFWV